MLFKKPLSRSISITSFYGHISGDIRDNVCFWHNIFIKLLVVSRYNSMVIIDDTVIVFIVHIENNQIMY